MAGAYEAAYSEFTGKFNLNGLNLKETYEINRKLNGINDFTFDSTPQKKEQSIYLDTLTSALTAYLEEKTKIEKDKEYNMSDVSIVDFMKEFDNVMNAIRTDEAAKNEPYKHTRFAGLSEGVMASRAWKNVKHFNQSLGGIWSDQIRKGTLTPEALQSMTNRSTSMLDGMVNNSIKYSDAAKKDLANVVMAKNAMEAAINKRSWTSWLNPLNWGPNRRENAYLKELEGKIESYKNAGFPVDNVVPEEYTKNMLGNALGELQKAYGAKNTTQKQTTSEIKQDIKENVQKENKNLDTSVNVEKEHVFNNEDEFIAASQNTVNNAKPAVKPVKEEKTNYVQRATELFEDGDFTDKLLDEMFGVVKKMESPSLRGSAKRSFLRVSAFKDSKEIAMTFCDRYDDAKTPEEKEEIVENYTIRMVADLTTSMNYFKFSDKDNIVAAQKIADLVLNKCTPIAFEGNKYAKYSDKFVAKNDELLNKVINQRSGRSDREIMEGARKDLGVDKKFEGLTEEEKSEKERRRAEAEHERIRIAKEKSMRERLEKIDEETPDLTKLFGDTERDRQLEEERIKNQKYSTYYGTYKR